MLNESTQQLAELSYLSKQRHVASFHWERVNLEILYTSLPFTLPSIDLTETLRFSHFDVKNITIKHTGGHDMKLVIKRFGQLTAKELYQILSLRAETFIVDQQIMYKRS